MNGDFFVLWSVSWEPMPSCHTSHGHSVTMRRTTGLFAHARHSKRCGRVIRITHRDRHHSGPVVVTILPGMIQGSQSLFTYSRAEWDPILGQVAVPSSFHPPSLYTDTAACNPGEVASDLSMWKRHRCTPKAPKSLPVSSAKDGLRDETEV